MIAEGVQLGLLGLTMAISVGGSIFTSGRYIGKFASKVAENETNIGLNKDAVKDLGDEVRMMGVDINKALNNGIRGDLAAIRTDVATVKTDVSHCKEATSKVVKMGEDLAFLRGQMSGNGEKNRRKGDDKVS